MSVTLGDKDNGGKNIAEVCALPINEASEYLNAVVLSEREKQIAERVLKEIQERLRFLLDVGLDYLSLDRPSGSLSGGEAQRIRLATQIAPAWSASSTSWTSRPSACTSATTRSSSRPSSGSRAWATP